MRYNIIIEGSREYSKIIEKETLEVDKMFFHDSVKEDKIYVTVASNSATFLIIHIII